MADGRRRPAIGGRGPFGKVMRPVGSEYVGKDGVVMVKVAEWPSKPGSKDNWRPKQRVVWERANGRELRRDEMVLFADHDGRNFDPGNLVAVPRRYIGAMRGLAAWSDAETCRAALAAAMVEVAANDAQSRCAECARCGRTFAYDHSLYRGRNRPSLCPECRTAFLAEHGRRPR